jgi:hypothetical protein
MEVNRATFRRMFIQCIFASGVAIHTGAPDWYEACMLLNSFVWARIIIGHRIRKMSWKQRYVVGIVVSHTSVWLIIKCCFIDHWLQWLLDSQMIGHGEIYQDQMYYSRIPDPGT